MENPVFAILECLLRVLVILVVITTIGGLGCFLIGVLSMKVTIVITLLLIAAVVVINVVY